MVGISQVSCLVHEGPHLVGSLGLGLVEKVHAGVSEGLGLQAVVGGLCVDDLGPFHYDVLWNLDYSLVVEVKRHLLPEAGIDGCQDLLSLFLGNQGGYFDALWYCRHIVCGFHHSESHDGSLYPVLSWRCGPAVRADFFHNVFFIGVGYQVVLLLGLWVLCFSI